MNRLLPVKFGNDSESQYTKSVVTGLINNQIVLFDSHRDILDISSSLKKWRIKRILKRLNNII